MAIASGLVTSMMKKLIAIGWLAGGGLLAAGAEELQWLTDLPKAQAKAKAENKLVMLEFTGSDWCIWCKRLKAEILSQAQFVEYARKNLVAVEVDFPHGKEQSAELKKANLQLQKQYDIKGLPTVLVLNRDGKPLGELDYQEGGPKPFIEKLEQLRKKS
jgi:protein disulfide-isomerase